VKDVGHQAPEDVIIAVIGNKCDLPNRDVPSHVGHNYAESIGAIFSETSAKSSVGVHDVFAKIGK